MKQNSRWSDLTNAPGLCFYSRAIPTVQWAWLQVHQKKGVWGLLTAPSTALCLPRSPLHLTMPEHRESDGLRLLVVTRLVRLRIPTQFPLVIDEIKGFMGSAWRYGDRMVVVRRA